VRAPALGLIAAVVVTSACLGGEAKQSPPPKLPTERCGSHVQTNFDPGLESRTIIAGPVALVPFRLAPATDATSPVRAFKVAVRVDAKARAALRTKTQATSLLFDREAFRRDNVYGLADGSKSVHFAGCRDRSAVFVGAVLSTGPTTLDLDVVVKGRSTPVTLTAFQG
jgi:hypothetical protein